MIRAFILALLLATPFIPGRQLAREVLTLPDGFEASVVAQGLQNPTSVAVSNDGVVYVAEYAGRVLELRDSTADGRYDEQHEFATGRFFINGIAFSPENELYISSQERVSIARETNGDGVAEIEDIISGLPTGAHQNNGLAFGPDGRLYITNGSTCDDCTEQDARSAAILRANADGNDIRVLATGLRNPYDLVFDSLGRLWATDNGSDAPCATVDELNLIVPGGHYGWPYGDDGCDPLHDGIPPIAGLGLHTAATGIDIYDGVQFPLAYRGDLFVTLWGSNDTADRDSGRVLVHASLRTVDGKTSVTLGQFAAGFENPIDVTVADDGSLLVLDFGAGSLYRIAYTG